MILVTRRHLHHTLVMMISDRHGPCKSSLALQLMFDLLICYLGHISGPWWWWWCWRGG